MTFSEEDKKKVMSKVIRGLEEDDCWSWSGYKNPTGYGGIHIQGKTYTAHKAVYEVLIGPVPDGMQAAHLCHDPDLCKEVQNCVHRLCCNPRHID